MSKVQYYVAASLDGFIATEDDGLEWLIDYGGTYEGEDAEPGPMSPGGSYDRFYADVGALVSGSATYEFLLDHLSAESEWPYPDRPYWVLSSRELPEAKHEGVDIHVTRLAIKGLYEEMRAAAAGRNLWVIGGGGVASQFAAEGLLDELILTVVPVVLGAGKPLFARELPGSGLQLRGSRAFGNGMVELRYGISR